MLGAKRCSFAAVVGFWIFLFCILNISAVFADTDTMGCWKLNEGSGTVASDATANSNTGTVYGAIWTNGSLDFDGTDDYVNIPSSTSLCVSSGLTIMAWVKPHSFHNNSYDGMVYKRYNLDNSYKTSYALSKSYAGGRVRFALTTSGGPGYAQSLLSASTMRLNKWQHVVVTYQSGDARIYLNGNLDASSAAITGTIMTDASALNIGKISTACFDGEIAEVRVYDRALTEEEVTENYESAGCWKMDEESGSTINDSADNYNNGTVSGATWSSDTQRDTMLQFDGTDDYASIPHSRSLDLTDKLTLMAWVKPASLSSGSYDGIVFKPYSADTTYGASYGICKYLSDGRICFFLSTSDGIGQYLVSNTAMTAGQWKHVTVTYQSGDARIYLNGVLDASSTSITGTILTDNNPLAIGVKGSSAYFNGAISDVGIYNRVLTVEEITEYCNMVGYWKLDEGTGTAIYDSSTCWNDGDIISGDWITDDPDMGTALGLDGTNDYATVPSSPSLCTGSEITVMAWVKPHSFHTNSYDGIVHKYYSLDNGYKTSYALTKSYAGGRVRFALTTSNGPGYAQALLSTSSMTLGEWQHVAATYKSGDLRIYLDGVQDAATTAITGTILADTGAVYVGKCGYGYFDGEVAEVRIYNRALTSGEVNQEYRNYTSTAYVVPAIKDNHILPGSYISNSYASNQIDIQACPGEYYPASFVINPKQDITGLTATVSNLVSGSNSIAASSINIRTVKCWYVKGGKFTPELLLKNDALVKTNMQTGDIAANYLYVPALNTPDGYINISGTSGIPGIPSEPTVSQFPVQDSSTLQSVNIPGGTNKQFWATVYVPTGTVAGTYQGTITLSTSGGTIQQFALTVTVLPITLLKPGDLPRPVEYSIYHTARLKSDPAMGSISRINKNATQYAAELANLFSHGVTNPNLFAGQDSLGTTLTARNNAGMGNQPLYYVGYQYWGYTDMNALQTSVTNMINTVTPYGVTDLYCYGRDEYDQNQYRTQIATVQAAGGKTFCAQTATQAAGVADVLDLAIVSAMDATLASSYHSYGNRIGSYANPQAGYEVPETYRRNYGLLIWQKDYDVVMDWAYQGSHNNIWDDFDDTTYPDEVFAYPTVDGVIDTIQWEGFRAGVDDMRYLATLIDAIDTAGYPANAEAQSWVDSLKTTDLTTVDLDYIRAKMIQFILALN